MSASLHPEEALQDLVDRRLSDTAAAEVRAHLVACAACRAIRDELVAAREAAAMLRTEVALPADLLASVQRQLDAEGIFRISGNATTVRKMKEMMEKGSILHNVVFMSKGEKSSFVVTDDAFDVASLLKVFSIVPSRLQNSYILENFQIRC